MMDYGNEKKMEEMKQKSRWKRKGNKMRRN